jgi:two-component system phosphate regulon sensor histidine kinase PhoR
VWNDFKQNLSSARVYLKEFLFFSTFIIIIIIEITDNQSESIPLIILCLLVSIGFLNFIGSKRNKELNEIKTLISNIRKNVYINSGDIKLSKYLTGLQEEIKLMFEKTKNDIEYLKKLERMRTEFLANVSHELRTPIFAIQGYIETLLNGAINDAKVNNSFLEKANLHTINLSSLLNDLIDISMIESGEMRMSFRYFNLNEYLVPLVKELSLMAEEKNLDLIYHPAKEGLLVFGDKNKLRQVFVNLVQNSIKYTEKGKVEILTEEEPKHARIIIRDTGIGIPGEDLTRIFERFYRVDKARSRAVGGTGLGLAIVKHIVEAHGSKIEVKSKLDEGSEFSFRLKK